jgi:hypothetical protein
MYTITVSNLPSKIETYKRIASESGLHDAESGQFMSLLLFLWICELSCLQVVNSLVGIL